MSTVAIVTSGVGRWRVALVGGEHDVLWCAPSLPLAADGLGAAVADALAEARRREIEVDGLALAIPDPAGGRDAAAALGRRHGLPWAVARFADALLEGERRLDTVRDVVDAVDAVLLDGDGAAVALLIGGRVHRGANGLAGEIAPLGLDRTGPIRCHGGLSGCLGALLAAGSAAPDAPRPVSSRPASTRRLGWLAVAGITLVNVLNPELLLVGGTVVDDLSDLAWFTEAVTMGCLGPTRSGLRDVTGAQADSDLTGMVALFAADRAAVRGAP